MVHWIVRVFDGKDIFVYRRKTAQTTSCDFGSKFKTLLRLILKRLKKYTYYLFDHFIMRWRRPMFN